VPAPPTTPVARKEDLARIEELTAQVHTAVMPRGHNQRTHGGLKSVCVCVCVCAAWCRCVRSQVSSLQQQLAGAEQAVALAKLAAAPAPVLATPEKAVPPPSSAGSNGNGSGDAAATAAWQEELARTTAQLQQATQRVAALEAERVRLERDAKEMSRSLAASIHSPHSSR